MPTFNPELKSARNPDGIEFSREEKDASWVSSYWRHAIEYGLQYYIAGRFAVAAAFSPVSGSLLHHAVEMILKACLAKEDTKAVIEAYRNRASYGHSLTSLWDEFKSRNSDIDLSVFSATIEELHEFEKIRYPERLIDWGALMQIGMHDCDLPDMRQSAAPIKEPRYKLLLPEVDRLVELLLARANVNLPAFRSICFSQHSKTYLGLRNGTGIPEQIAGA